MQSRGGISGSRDRAAAPGAAVPLRAGRRRDRRAAMAGEAAGCRDLITVDIGGTSCDIALIESGTPALRSEGMIDGYPGARRHGRRQFDRLGRRLDRLARRRGRPARRSAVGGLGAGTCLLRPRRHASRPSPMPRSCWAISTRTISPAAASSCGPSLAREAIERVVARPLRPHGRAGGARHPSHRSTPRWRRASASCRSARGTIRAGSRCCRSAAAARCMPARWPRSSASTRILVPRHPGVLSAAGLLAAPDRARGHRPRCRGAMDEFDLGRGRAHACTQLDGRCSALMRDEKCRARRGRRCATSPTSATPARAITWRCRSSSHAADPFGALTAAFYAAHDRTYGYAPQAPIRLVNLRSVHTRRGLDKLQEDDWTPADARRADPPAHASCCPSGSAAGRGRGLRPRRAEGRRHFDGPAIVEQDDTTTLVTAGLARPRRSARQPRCSNARPN